MLGMIATEDLEMEASDVGNAYLESVVDKDLYMLLPTDLLLYVDDLIIAAKAQSKIDEVKRLLECRFKMKHQQIVTQYLGFPPRSCVCRRAVTRSRCMKS
mmetsp:Transcript_5769/g.12706  ORF Transcript_5769/g.12706 Transcript_5769/m.12706 type:complete len:100 (+) Transcript_5769:259-558(+)